MDPDDDAADPDDNIVIRDECDVKHEECDPNSGSRAADNKKPRKKQNRFNGLSEEELSKRLLPDLIAPDLDILIVS